MNLKKTYIHSGYSNRFESFTRFIMHAGRNRNASFRLAEIRTYHMSYLNTSLWLAYGGCRVFQFLNVLFLHDV